MRAPNLLKRLLSGLKAQMVRIVQTEITPRLSQLFRRKSLERRLGRNRHEDRQRYGAMGQRQHRSPRFCGLFAKKREPPSSVFESLNAVKVFLMFLEVIEWEKMGT